MRHGDRVGLAREDLGRPSIDQVGGLQFITDANIQFALRLDGGLRAAVDDHRFCRWFTRVPVT